jgi:hypothetical protein
MSREDVVGRLGFFAGNFVDGGMYLYDAGNNFIDRGIGLGVPALRAVGNTILRVL